MEYSLDKFLRQYSKGIHVQEFHPKWEEFFDQSLRCTKGNLKKWLLSFNPQKVFITDIGYIYSTKDMEMMPVYRNGKMRIEPKEWLEQEEEWLHRLLHLLQINDGSIRLKDIASVWNTEYGEVLHQKPKTLRWWIEGLKSRVFIYHDKVMLADDLSTAELRPTERKLKSNNPRWNAPSWRDCARDNKPSHQPLQDPSSLSNNWTPVSTVSNPNSHLYPTPRPSHFKSLDSVLSHDASNSHYQQQQQQQQQHHQHHYQAPVPAWRRRRHHHITADDERASPPQSAKSTMKPKVRAALDPSGVGPRVTGCPPYHLNPSVCESLSSSSSSPPSVVGPRKNDGGCHSTVSSTTTTTSTSRYKPPQREASRWVDAPPSTLPPPPPSVSPRPPPPSSAPQDLVFPPPSSTTASSEDSVTTTTSTSTTSSTMTRRIGRKMESMESPTSGSAASSVERRCGSSSEDREETQLQQQQQKQQQQQQKQQQQQQKQKQEQEQKPQQGPEEFVRLGQRHERSMRLRRGTEQEITDKNKRKWEVVAYELWKAPMVGRNQGKEENKGKDKDKDEESMERSNLCSSWSDKSVEEMWGMINQGWDAYDAESMGEDEEDDQSEAKDDEDEDGSKIIEGPWSSIYEAHSLCAKELLDEVDNFSYCERWKNKPSLLTRL